jgi:hypothetical protein
VCSGGLALLPTATLADPPPPNGGYGWQTRQPSLICVSYFAIYEAAQAAKAGDSGWLKELNCGLVRGGIKLIIIPQPPQNYEAEIYRVRLMPANMEPVTVYIQNVDAVHYVSGGKYKTKK